MNSVLKIGGAGLNRGERRTVDIALPRLYTHTEISMPVQVFRGKKDGPVLLICAALHGDELNGVEIIRRISSVIDPSQLKGTIITVPVVNVFGFITQSRYLPDRRDLNRSFPGSQRGSLTARLANTFMKEIVEKCDYGIDLHTASFNRINLPQIRADLSDPETRNLSMAFGARIIIHSDTRDGSLREAAVKRGIKMMVFEGGEALRFDPESIETGVRGILRIMSLLKMRKGKSRKLRKKTPVILSKTTWIRARNSGILRLAVDLGEKISRRQILGAISDPLDEKPVHIRSPRNGIVIGKINNPLVHRGDAMVHIGIQPEKPE